MHVIFPEKELEIFILIKVLHITKREIPKDSYKEDNRIYDLSGRIVAKNGSPTEKLPKGVYIQNGKNNFSLW